MAPIPWRPISVPNKTLGNNSVSFHDMLLLLSSSNLANSTYATEEGQILYKVTKPIIGAATIRKAVGTIQGVWNGDMGTYELQRPKAKPTSRTSRDGSAIVEGEDQVIDETDDGSDLPVLEGHFAFFAQIEFHAFQKSMFRYNSLEVPVQKFLRRTGWNWQGKIRVFKACDGQEYRWEMRAGHCYVLFRKDESQKQVAKYLSSRPNLGPLLNSRQGSLEVDPTCEPILDEIVMTFVYMHVVDKG